MQLGLRNPFKRDSKNNDGISIQRCETRTTKDGKVYRKSLPKTNYTPNLNVAKMLKYIALMLKEMAAANRKSDPVRKTPNPKVYKNKAARKVIRKAVRLYQTGENKRCIMALAPQPENA